MAAAMACKNLTRCAEAPFSKRISKALLGIEARSSQKSVWIWQGSVRMCWTKRNPLSSPHVLRKVEDKVLEGPSSRAPAISRISCTLDLEKKTGSSNVASAARLRGRRFPRNSVLHEEYQLASVGASSLSRVVGTAHHSDTSNICHEVRDMSEEDVENLNDLVAGSLTSPQDSRGPENSNSFATGTTQRWFPYEDCFKLDDERSLRSSEVLSMLSPFLGDERKQRIEEVVANRTYSICIAVEGLLDLGNVSAVCRSADALGFQSVHVISNETKKRYKKNRKVSMGTEKWLDAELWSNTSDCIDTLRQRGYRIAVTHIAPDTVSIYDMDWTIPTAVFFGNEFMGASEEAIKQSDVRCCIPMAGMVESFNISVAAGIIMHHAARDRIIRSGVHGDISPEDRRILEAEFCLRHNRHTVPLLDRLLEKKGQAADGPEMTDIFSEELLSDIEMPEYLKM
ncbi:uncharacterized protein [Physcomitrium patens]|uniref:tRNA/rRNA methyltransferase SpoU type domain-containing protein n=1 Tax=Physcomitrium patens TaxID=3218 RepID=A0A2K1JRE5_PHYPA|nr:uncharacterized protein LOC112289676 [Physcomitrium patens]PNR44105.1 hypothetical protein PHYPA_016488 [Physcomitrium patens]|eukprot:XP_024390864.1 uncharacterized protein LOC112289676 [Physcomitrella patens]